MNQLPPGWARVPLGTVIRIRNGYAFKSADFTASGVPLIRQSNLTGQNVDLTKCVYLPERIARDSSTFLVHKGDILIGMSGSIGEPSVYEGEIPALQNQRTGMIVFREKDSGHREFIRFFLRFSEREYSRKGKGIAVQNVSASDIESIELPLPPLVEQQRIVAKLNRLLMHSKCTREHLTRIPGLVERSKQAILSAAFRGDLTAEWRASANRSIGEWRSASLRDIADIGTGATPKRGNARFYHNGTIPWITSGAVNEDAIDHAEEMITEAALKETNCKVFPPGTLLVAMYGEGQTRGKVSILKIHAATNQALAAISVRESAPVAKMFVFWFFRANYLELRGQAAGGVQPNLNLGIIKATTMTLPSIEEQLEIVRRIDQLLKRVESLSREASTSLMLLDRLEMATLAKALRGELVPQDPDAEPLAEFCSPAGDPIGRVPERAARAGQSTHARGKKRSMTKSRYDEDVNGKPYLAGILRMIGNSANIEELFQRSELPVTDFYKQLASEVEAGHIRDDQKRLEPS